MPFVEKDAFDETTGKRATTNRANYLADELQAYYD